MQNEDQDISPKFIKEARHKTGLSCYEFALIFGFTGKKETLNRQIRSWESADRIPNKPAQQIIKYIHKFGVEDNHFFDFLVDDIRLNIN